LISPVFGFVSVELEGRLSARSVFTDSYAALSSRLRLSRIFFFARVETARRRRRSCNRPDPVA